MTVETVRSICLAFSGVTEDVKWGNDLVFSVGTKMFAAVDIDPPHSLSFKCSVEAFNELVERDGIVPAPYLARAMWVQQEKLGGALDRRELESLLRKWELSCRGEAAGVETTRGERLNDSRDSWTEKGSRSRRSAKK